MTARRMVREPDDEDDEYPDQESAVLMLRYLVRSWGLPANDETRDYSVKWGLKALDYILTPKSKRRRRIA